MSKSTGLIALIILLVCAPAHAQDYEKGYQAETNRYVFYAHYWLNLHHFLQQEALLRKVADSSAIDSTKWKGLESYEQSVFNEVISFYQDSLVARDLRSDDYQQAFRSWVITQEDNRLIRIPIKFQAHVENLIRVSLFYKTHFWDNHLMSIRSILENNLALIDSTEEQVSARLSELTGSSWQNEKIRVDICYYAKASEWNLRNRPFTSLYPTHVVMNASEASDSPHGNWLELLYHESSHHLIGPNKGFVAESIQKASSFLKAETPRGLWHAYLFYFAGKTTKGVLATNNIAEYELYMVRNEVFDAYYHVLDQHLSKYLNGKKNLKEVSIQIIRKLKSR